MQAIEAWHQYINLTQPLAQQLSEQLRLTLEPTLAAKLRGDYRTGKRLNMRKVRFTLQYFQVLQESFNLLLLNF